MKIFKKQFDENKELARKGWLHPQIYWPRSQLIGKGFISKSSDPYIFRLPHQFRSNYISFLNDILPDNAYEKAILPSSFDIEITRKLKKKWVSYTSNFKKSSLSLKQQTANENFQPTLEELFGWNRPSDDVVDAVCDLIYTAIVKDNILQIPDELRPYIEN